LGEDSRVAKFPAQDRATIGVWKRERRFKHFTITFAFLRA
jgi:hypothetical protein